MLAWLLPATGFALAATFTPGPNNTMLAASGANFGFARTAPHMAGVSLGFCVMFVSVALGAGSVLRAVPVLYTVLRYVGAAYLLYLAWKIATSAPAAGEAGTRRARPFTFLQAAAFQWVNPKAWAGAAGASVTYISPDELYLRTAAIALMFLVVTFGSVTFWTAIGAGVARLLPGPKALRTFNLVMAALLVLSILPMLGD